MFVEWRIYYADGSTFDSRQGDPKDAPGYGVICIVFYEALGKRIIAHLKDWYYWLPDVNEWWGSDIFGLLDQMTLQGLAFMERGFWYFQNVQTSPKLSRDVLIYKLLDEGYIKMGRNVSGEVYRGSMERADRDPDFPPSSGRRPGANPE